MARLTKPVRRDAIIDAALAVIGRKGIGATTARDVAAQMGTSSGLIHHYFVSMDELLAAAFDRAVSADLAATVAVVEAVDTPLEQLLAFFRTYQRTDGDWGYQVWLDAWSEAARRPTLRDTSQRLNVSWQHTLQRIFVAGVADGTFVCDDPDSAAWRVLSLLDGLALQVVAHPDALSANDVLPWSMRLAELELALPAGTLSFDAAADAGHRLAPS
jgi:AcrR family transcriptional regulator